MCEVERTSANAIIGKMTPIESMLSKRSARPTSSLDLRLRIRLLSAQSWPKSITRSLFPSSFHFNPLKSFTLYWLSLMVESCFITCSASSASMLIERGSTQLNSFAPWNVYTVSTLSTGTSNQKTFYSTILDTSLYATSGFARWT